jgi:hypothetical protein
MAGFRPVFEQGSYRKLANPLGHLYLIFSSVFFATVDSCTAK